MVSCKFLGLFFGQLPAHIKLRYSTGKLDSDAVSRKKKGKSKEGETDLEIEKPIEASQEKRLATLDIFAGCGGLSEGLHQSGKFLMFDISFTVMLVYIIKHLMIRVSCLFVGASITKWAIEYEEPAGDAFKLNHQESSVFVNNCNVILR